LAVELTKFSTATLHEIESWRMTAQNEPIIRHKLIDTAKSNMATFTFDKYELVPLSTLGIRFSRIDEIYDLLGGKELLRGRSTRDVQYRLRTITVESRQSLCSQLLEESGQELVSEANWFITHAWDYKFLDVMEAIELFFQVEYGSDRMNEAVIWFDLFSVTQHGMGSQPFEWWTTVVRNAVKTIGNMLIILEPWENPVALSRSWCVFEIFTSVVTKCRFEMSMSRKESDRLLDMITRETKVKDLYGLLSKIKTAKCSAYYETDVLMIQSSVVGVLEHGFSELDSKVFRKMESWILSRMQARCVDGLLNSLSSIQLQLQMSLLLSLLGKHEDAMAVATRCHQLGEISDDRSTLVSCLQNLVTVSIYAGKYEDVEQLCSRSEEISKNLFGPEHPDTISCTESLATLFRYQGKYNAAEPLQRRSYDDRGRILGYSHPDTLHSLNNLATLLGAQGKYDDAEQLHRRCLGTCAELWPDHPVELTCTDNLASLYVAMGKYETADDLYRHSLQACHRLWGPKHANTIRTMNSLAGLYCSAEKYAEADALSEICNNVSKEVLLQNHPDALAILNTTAVLHCAQGRLALAEPILRTCIEQRIYTLGSTHPDTLCSMDNMVALKIKQGEVRSAHELCKKCLELRTQALGCEHPDTWKSNNNLAVVLMKQGELEIAELQFRQCLEFRHRVLGPEHRDTLRSVANLAILFETQGKHQEAEPLFRKCIFKSAHAGMVQLVEDVLHSRSDLSNISNDMV
jgi:tetratricopeptide (TPR) repeat protein